jgi:hypothetical protein
MAFSSEVDTGSREENASKQRPEYSVLIKSEPNRRQSRMAIPERRMDLVTLPFASPGWRD